MKLRRFLHWFMGCTDCSLGRFSHKTTWIQFTREAGREDRRLCKYCWMRHVGQTYAAFETLSVPLPDEEG